VSPALDLWQVTARVSGWRDGRSHDTSVVGLDVTGNFAA
jgi:hypothetical protein